MTVVNVFRLLNLTHVNTLMSTFETVELLSCYMHNYVALLSCLVGNFFKACLIFSCSFLLNSHWRKGTYRASISALHQDM